MVLPSWYWLTRVQQQPFNGLFSRTTWVSQHQKGKSNLDFTGARESEWQWHQLGRMQVCTSLQTDNHASTPHSVFLQARCPSCRPTNSVKALKAMAHPGSPGQRVRALSSHSSVLRVYECFVRNCNFILFMSGLPRLCYRLAALASYSFLCSFSRIAVFGVGHFPWIIWFYSEYSVSLIPVFLLTLHTSASGHLCQFMSIYYYRCPALHQSVSHLPHSAFVLQILPFVD